MPPTPKRRPSPKALSRDEVQNRYHQPSLAELAMADAQEVDDLTRELLEHILDTPRLDIVLEEEETVTYKDGSPVLEEDGEEVKRTDLYRNPDWLEWRDRALAAAGRLERLRALRDARLAAARMSDLKRKLDAG